MNQIRIFNDEDEYRLEKTVNNFIKDKKVINVSYSARDIGYSNWYTCCVLYEKE